jgi:hypothetical protein
MDSERTMRRNSSTQLIQPYEMAALLGEEFCAALLLEALAGVPLPGGNTAKRFPRGYKQAE